MLTFCSSSAQECQDNKKNSTQQAQNGSRAAGQQQRVTVDGSRGRQGCTDGTRQGLSANSGTKGRGGRGGRGRGMRGGSTAKETAVDGVAGNERSPLACTYAEVTATCMWQFV